MLALLLALLPASPVAPQRSVPPASRPDVVVFVIDDVADSDIDDIPTPTLDALAAGGVRFRRAYSHAKCAPTRDSLLYGHWLGLDRGDACAPANPATRNWRDLSLAQVFRGQGYQTLHVGKWHVGTHDLAGAGWEVTPQLAGFTATRNEVPIGPICNQPGAAQPRVDDGVFSITHRDNTIGCRDAFAAWWMATPSPRFAMVNFGSAHAPFKRPPSSILPPGTPNPIDPTNRQEYEWEVQGVDFVIGQLLPMIPPTAYVVFLGDNGTPGLVPGESPSVTVATRPDQDPARVKLTCYEDGVRIPLIFHGPRLAMGHESQALVSVADLFPTLARIAGCKPAVPVQGADFTAALLGLPGPRSAVFCWNPPPRLDRAMIGRRWKLLTRPDGVEELYDLRDDPLEAAPLPPIGREADRLRALRDLILSGGG